MVDCAGRNSRAGNAELTARLSANRRNLSMNIQPYTVRISDEDLDDLRDRLARTRWPDEIEGADWDYGSNLAYIRELCDYLSLIHI